MFWFNTTMARMAAKKIRSSVLAAFLKKWPAIHADNASEEAIKKGRDSVP